jgi:hypothetical protein
MHNKYPNFFRPVSSLWYMFHLSFFGSVVEVDEFDDKFFLGGNEIPKKGDSLN